MRFIFTTDESGFRKTPDGVLCAVYRGTKHDQLEPSVDNRAFMPFYPDGSIIQGVAIQVVQTVAARYNDIKNDTGWYDKYYKEGSDDLVVIKDVLDLNGGHILPYEIVTIVFFKVV